MHRERGPPARSGPESAVGWVSSQRPGVGGAAATGTGRALGARRLRRFTFRMSRRVRTRPNAPRSSGLKAARRAERGRSARSARGSQGRVRKIHGADLPRANFPGDVPPGRGAGALRFLEARAGRLCSPPLASVGRQTEPRGVHDRWAHGADRSSQRGRQRGRKRHLHRVRKHRRQGGTARKVRSLGDDEPRFLPPARRLPTGSRPCLLRAGRRLIPVPSP